MYMNANSSVIGVQEVPDQEVSKYGVISINQNGMDNGVFHINNLVEKPKIEDAPSNYAIMGRYVLRPEIFDILENQTPGAGNEIQLTDAIKKLNEQQMVVGYEFEGDRHDVGDKFEFIKATVEFALEREDLKGQVIDYLKEVLKKEKIEEK
jgi:UTP--glucose-1-phosphate uridylyltransferase